MIFLGSIFKVHFEFYMPSHLFSLCINIDLMAVKMVIPPMKRNGSGKSMNRKKNNGMDLEITASVGFAGLTRQVVSSPGCSSLTVFRMVPTPMLLLMPERKKS